MKQISFSFIEENPSDQNLAIKSIPQKEYGGTLLAGKRKSKRPLSTKKPIHIVIRSNHKSIFNPSNQSLDQLIRTQTEKFHIRLYDFALNWSHIHLLIRIKDQQNYVRFIRSLTAILSLRVRQYQKTQTSIKTFTLRPYSRIIEWGKDFKGVQNYQALNQLEARGFIRR